MTINANSGRIPLKSAVRLAVLVLMFAAGALLMGGTAHARLVPIDVIAIDLDPTGNTGSAINGHAAGAVVASDIQDCIQVAPGALFDINVVMSGLPATPTVGDRLAGFNFDIGYSTAAPAFGAPPNLVAAGLVLGNDDDLDGLYDEDTQFDLLDQDGNNGDGEEGGSPPYIGHDVDGSAGAFAHTAGDVILPGSVDISVANGQNAGLWNVWRTVAFKTGGFTVGPKAGVMDWIKVRAGLVPGQYPLTLSNVGVTSAGQGNYTISNILGATIAVGMSCPIVSTSSLKFCIIGSSTGAGWMWNTKGTNGFFSGTVAAGTVLSGGAASDIADEWVNSMNGPAPAFGGVSPKASRLPGDCFDITPGGQILIVDGCRVTPSGCSFNPTVFEVLAVGGISELLVGGPDASARDTGGSGPSALPYAALAGGVVAAALVLATSGWYVRRRLE